MEEGNYQLRQLLYNTPFVKPFNTLCLFLDKQTGGKIYTLVTNRGGGS